MNAVDWSAFLARHDIHFGALPGCWEEAPHFGNAMVGSMLYMREERLCLEVFRADVRDHRDESHGWTAYSRPRFRIGCFTLDTVGTPNGCKWRKDLWHAELTGTVTTDRGEIAIRHFVHAEDMAIVTEFLPSGGEAVRWKWHPFEARTTRPGYPSDEESLTEYAERYGEHYLEMLKPLTLNPDGRLDSREGVSVWTQDLAAGGRYAIAWAEACEGGTRTHIASIANSYPGTDAAETAVRDVALSLAVNRADWIREHRAWWHAYYRRSFVTIPDKTLESLYWQTVYRYGCTSRTGRSYVDTSGLWFQGGPWPYATHDWNTQSAHWGVYAANRLEQGQEVVNRLHANRDNLVKAVLPEEWQGDSAYLHLATAGDMLGSRRSDMRYYECVGCLPWLLHNAWWQYRFSMDDAMLREKIHPLLRRAMNLYFHLLEEDEDGALHLQPTYSPETGVWRDCNFDLALFKWGCHTLLKVCRRLGIDDPLLPRWRDAIEKLADFPADEHGFRLGADETSRDRHRHFSNLLMIYPLYLVNIEQDGTIDVLRRSAERAHRTRGLDAMVQTHAGPIGAALGMGDQALEGIERLAAELHPNGLWSCGGNPCIESTLSLANNIQEMLLQSWSDPASDEPGAIRIFPALPSSWQDVEFHDLRAAGAFLVSAKRSGGVTRWVRIKSLAGEPCRVKADLTAPRVTGAREHALSEVVPGVFCIDIERGEEVVISGEDHE